MPSEPFVCESCNLPIPEHKGGAVQDSFEIEPPGGGSLIVCEKCYIKHQRLGWDDEGILMEDR